MSFNEVLLELPSLTLEQRQLLIRRAFTHRVSAHYEGFPTADKRERASLITATKSREGDVPPSPIIALTALLHPRRGTSGGSIQMPLRPRPCAGQSPGANVRRTNR